MGEIEVVKNSVGDWEFRDGERVLMCIAEISDDVLTNFFIHVPGDCPIFHSAYEKDPGAWELIVPHSNPGI